MNELRESRHRADCAVRALAVACGVTYEQAESALRQVGRKRGQGTYDCELMRAATRLGYQLRYGNVSQGTTVRQISRELPSGAWIAFTRGHCLGVRNGTVYDKRTEGKKFRVKRVMKAVKRG